MFNEEISVEKILEEVYETFSSKEKMPENEPCKMVNFMEDGHQTIGIIHIGCDEKKRGYLYYCERCDKMFPKELLERRLNLVKALNISGMEIVRA